MAENFRFAESDSLLCYHGPMLYEAKCLKRRKSNDGKAQYFIHYKGWNSKWEEWVDDNRVLAVNAGNMNKMASLKELHSSSKKGGAKRSVTVIKEETVRNTTPPVKGRKRKHSEISLESNQSLNVLSPIEPKLKKRVGRPPKISINSQTETSEAFEITDKSKKIEPSEENDVTETILKTEEVKAIEEIIKTDDIYEIKTDDILKTVTTEIVEEIKVSVTEKLDKTEANYDNEAVKKPQGVERLEPVRRTVSVKGINSVEETKIVDGTETAEETETIKEPRTDEEIETIEETQIGEETETVEGNSTDNMFIVPAPVIKKIPIINIPNVLKQKIAHDSVMVNTLNKVLRFPKITTVQELIHSFIYSKQKTHIHWERSFNIGITLMQYFNLLIHKQLLYETERKIEMNKKAKRCLYRKIHSGRIKKFPFKKILYPVKLWHNIYSPTYLLRLFVILPQVLSTYSYTDNQLDLIVEGFEDFLKYVEDNQEKYFTENDYRSNSKLSDEN